MWNFSFFLSSFIFFFSNFEIFSVHLSLCSQPELDKDWLLLPFDANICGTIICAHFEFPRTLPLAPPLEQINPAHNSKSVPLLLRRGAKYFFNDFFSRTYPWASRLCTFSWRVLSCPKSTCQLARKFRAWACTWST